MPMYLALARLAMPQGIVEAGEKFASDLVPGKFWKPIDKEAKAAVKARDQAKAAPAGDEQVSALEAALAEAKAEINRLQAEIEVLTAPPAEAVVE